jgi:hypothetical protein
MIFDWLHTLDPAGKSKLNKNKNISFQLSSQRIHSSISAQSKGFYLHREPRKWRLLFRIHTIIKKDSKTDWFRKSIQNFLSVCQNKLSLIEDFAT